MGPRPWLRLVGARLFSRTVVETTTCPFHDDECAHLVGGGPSTFIETTRPYYPAAPEKKPKKRSK